MAKLEDRPGPGFYESPGRIDQNNGFQMISNFRTVKARRFGTALRTENDSKLDTPGPGSYRPPSDFGYLDFKPKTGYTPSSQRPRMNHNLITRNVRQISVDQISKRDVKFVNFHFLVNSKSSRWYG
jgi:hypothetical protein